MKKLCFLLTLGFLLAISSYGQPYENWSRDYDSGTRDYVIDVFENHHASVLLTLQGETPSGDYQLYSREHKKENGNLTDHIVFDTSLPDFTTCFKRDASGNLYVFCNSETYGDGTFVKYSVKGKERWRLTLPVRAFGIELDNKGNPVLGYTYGGDIYLRKFKASNGDIMWTASHSYSGDNHETPKLYKDNTGNFYIAGQSMEPYPSEDSKMTTIKYGNNGLFLGHFSYDARSDDSRENADVMAFDASNNFYMIAALDTIYDNDPFVITKFTSTGTFLWAQIVSGATGINYPQAAHFDGANNIIVSGHAVIPWTPSAEPTSRVWLRKFTPAGTTIWNVIPQDPSITLDIHEVPMNIEQNPYGDIIIGGRKHPAPGVRVGFWEKIKASTGDVDIYSGGALTTDYDYPSDFLFDGTDMYSGNINGLLSLQDAQIKKFSTTLPVSTHRYAAEPENEVMTIYPNPVNTNFVITGIIDPCDVEIFDTQGRIMLRKNYSGGELDVTNLTNGIYFVRVKKGEESKCYRIIKQ